MPEPLLPREAGERGKCSTPGTRPADLSKGVQRRILSGCLLCCSCCLRLHLGRASRAAPAIQCATSVWHSTCTKAHQTRPVSDAPLDARSRCAAQHPPPNFPAVPEASRKSPRQYQHFPAARITAATYPSLAVPVRGLAPRTTAIRQKERISRCLAAPERARAAPLWFIAPVAPAAGTPGTWVPVPFPTPRGDDGCADSRYSDGARRRCWP